MNKRGGLTDTQIIMLVIAIVGFGIVLIALFLVNLGGYSAEDTCKLSVLTRATTPLVVNQAVPIPLKCTTKKICIANDLFGACKEQFAGESNVEVVRLSGTIDDKRKQIEEVSANAMYDCWSMMGEGKLDLFRTLTASVSGKVVSRCVICSRVALDKSVTEDKNIIYVNGDVNQGSAIKINDYLKTHQIPGQSLTYSQAFTDRGTNSFASVAEEDFNKLGAASGTTKFASSNNDLAFLFMQIKSEKVGDVLSNLGTLVGVTAVSVYLSPVGGIVGKVIGFVGVGTVAVVGTVAAGVAGGVVTYNALEGQKVAAMHCGEFVSGEAGQKGCSLVQGVSYNADTINKVCDAIEGEL